MFRRIARDSAGLNFIPREKVDSRLTATTVELFKTLAQLPKTEVLVIDEWALAPLTDESRRDLIEIFDDRHGTRATIITSQLYEVLETVYVMPTAACRGLPIPPP